MQDFEIQFSKEIKARLREAAKETQQSQPEQHKKKEVVSYKGAIGSGFWKASLRSSKSKASENPRELMKLLGVTDVKGQNDAERTLSVVRQAIHNNEVMSSAYDQPRYFKKKIGNAEGVVFEVRILDEELPYRDGVFFLYLTILGAHNAGLLRSKSTIRFLQDGQSTGNPTFFVEM